MSDHQGAALIYPMLPDAETIIADKGYDCDAFREALAGRAITPCIPPRAKRRLLATCTARLCISFGWLLRQPSEPDQHSR
jgi:transposase